MLPSDFVTLGLVELEESGRPTVASRGGSGRSPTRTEASEASSRLSPHRVDATGAPDDQPEQADQGLESFDVLASEFQDPKMRDPGVNPLLFQDDGPDKYSERPHHKRVRSSHHMNDNFWHRMRREASTNASLASKMSHENKGDPYFDFKEKRNSILTAYGQEIELPTLVECKKLLVNKEKEAHQKRSGEYKHIIQDLVLDVFAGFCIYFANTVCVETVLVVANAAAATTFFCLNYDRFAVRLDFSFLSFAVVFPLTFLIQAVFSRRDMALTRLADFKASILSTTLFTMTVDWPTKDGHPTGGRASLPISFNDNVLKDAQSLVRHSYEYLSMPNVSHARNLVFRSKQKSTRRVHAIQNDIVKRINDTLFDFSMHTEEMRRCGFPSGEASRLHQFHYFLSRRFEQLRVFKYYRTPQATRSFGLAYILVLPWMSGPYFAYVYESTNMAMTTALGAFTFLVLLGLLNTQKGLEDPFYMDHRTWLPGMIDSIKLDFEMAVVLQTLEQYYANAELRRIYEDEHADDGFSV